MYFQCIQFKHITQHSFIHSLIYQQTKQLKIAVVGQTLTLTLNNLDKLSEYYSLSLRKKEEKKSWNSEHCAVF